MTFLNNIKHSKKRSNEQIFPCNVFIEYLLKSLNKSANQSENYEIRLICCENY